MPFIGREAQRGVVRFKFPGQRRLTATRETDHQMKCRHVSFLLPMQPMFTDRCASALARYRITCVTMPRAHLSFLGVILVLPARAIPPVRVLQEQRAEIESERRN